VGLNIVLVLVLVLVLEPGACRSIGVLRPVSIVKSRYSETAKLPIFYPGLAGFSLGRRFIG